MIFQCHFQRQIFIVGHTYGTCDTALTWISSYLQNRSFRVCVGDATSSIQNLHFGIPQGSVVGPLFFVLYTCCLGAIIRKYDIMYHIYADDVQLHLREWSKTCRYCEGRVTMAAPGSMPLCVTTYTATYVWLYMLQPCKISEPIAASPHRTPHH